MSKVLVVAFDGMDKELIEEFGLENIPQREFGKIDNSTKISRRMTSELFASFITGETHEVHGVKGLSKDLSLKNRVLKHIFTRTVINYIPGAYRIKNLIMDEMEEERLYTKEDLNADTLFENIDAGLPLFVPSYNPSIYWLSGMPLTSLKFYGRKRLLEECKHDTSMRLYEGTATQPAFFDVNEVFWDFIMLHLHDPDTLQDAEVGELTEEYSRLDEVAGKILEKYEDWTVIFMSDHGRPVGGIGPHEHNENAFYSCNQELFSDRTPHITDFHDRILEIVGEGEDE